MIKVSTSIPKILGKLYGFPKKIEKSGTFLRTFPDLANRHFTEIFCLVPVRSPRLVLDETRITRNNIEKKVVSMEVIIFAILQGTSKKR